MIRHFGLNEITSYQTVEYIDIRESCTDELKMLTMEKKTLNKHESKIDKVISENKCRFLADKKAYLDAVKITARNIFYLLSRIFRPIYNNYRNDHQILRELLRSRWTLISCGSFMKAELDVTRIFQPEQLNKINLFLGEISENINSSKCFEKPIKLVIRKVKISKIQKLQIV
ncbi:MAG TPA: hypothetical protein DD381_08885 [Lentisphaeria bacterium]|nr:MAG: hypothetical protein A2X47_07965 [Lentisphaerae bacterium GWF2_38_69]HBM16437.1 hypothetical protein [Lentisphaeria bacterium]